MASAARTRSPGPGRAPRSPWPRPDRSPGVGRLGLAGELHVGRLALGLGLARLGLVALDLDRPAPARAGPACRPCPWPSPSRCAAVCARCCSSNVAFSWLAISRWVSTIDELLRGTRRPGCRRRASRPRTASRYARDAPRTRLPAPPARVSMNSHRLERLQRVAEVVAHRRLQHLVDEVAHRADHRDDLRAPACRARGSAPAGRS